VSPRRWKAVVKAEHCHEEITVHDNETVLLHTNGKVYFQFFWVKSWERHSKNKALVSIPYVYRSALLFNFGLFLKSQCSGPDWLIKSQIKLRLKILF
jgi:hypothetical protein